MQSILALINKKVEKLAEKVQELFPEITVEEVLSIWHEQQQICGIDSLDDEDTVDKVLPKTCQHVYIKGPKANKQCKVKIKGEFCSKHKL